MVVTEAVWVNLLLAAGLILFVWEAPRGAPGRASP